MTTMMMGNRLPDDRIWAADTGCFATPEKYSDEKYLAWLASRVHAADRCLFATAPDGWGDGIATLEKTRPVLALTREAGLPAALVLQPGIAATDIPWDDLDAVFTGGPDEWQRSETVLGIVVEAKRRGKWAHQGRVNSQARLQAARVTGYDSADGTFVAFGPDTNMPKVQQWVDRIAAQPTLFTMGGLT